MSRQEKAPVARGRAPAARRRQTGRRPAALRSRVKVQIDLSCGSRIGPGKIQLLELLETEGSLSRAAGAMGISYRRAWLFVQQINAAFDKPAVVTPEHRHGGAAARLTAFGRALIARYRALEALTSTGGAMVLSWIERHERID